MAGDGLEFLGIFVAGEAIGVGVGTCVLDGFVVRVGDIEEPVSEAIAFGGEAAV